MVQNRYTTILSAAHFSDVVFVTSLIIIYKLKIKISLFFSATLRLNSSATYKKYKKKKKKIETTKITNELITRRHTYKVGVRVVK